MAMVIETQFEIGQTVYLKTDKLQDPRIVTGIKIAPSGLIYFLSQGTAETQHYEMEIAAEVNELIKVQ